MAKTEKAPQWVEKVVRVAAKNIKPHSVMGPMGWEFKAPNGPREAWEISIFPTPSQIYAGPYDGMNINPAYLWNLSDVIRLFDAMPRITMIVPVKRTDKFSGPELGLVGVLDKLPVWIRLFSSPPVDERPSVMIDPANNKIWPADKPQKRKHPLCVEEGDDDDEE